jgi:hypothetical protein
MMNNEITSRVNASGYTTLTGSAESIQVGQDATWQDGSSTFTGRVVTVKQLPDGRVEGLVPVARRLVTTAAETEYLAATARSRRQERTPAAAVKRPVRRRPARLTAAQRNLDADLYEDLGGSMFAAERIRLGY